MDDALAFSCGYLLAGLLCMRWAERRERELFDEGVGERLLFLVVWPVFVAAVVSGIIKGLRRRFDR